jgi:hypothetical protein
MSDIHVPTTTGTSYVHLRPQVNKKINFYGDYQKKNYHSFKKFQTGSTTTFGGYTNIGHSNYIHQKHAPRKFNTKKSTSSSYERKTRSSNDNEFKQPPRKNRRTITHAKQYMSHTSSIIYERENYEKHEFNNDNYSRLNTLKCLILSDSMCKYIRPEKLTSNQIDVKLSYESGCTCSRMANFLQDQANINNNDMFKANVIVYSLCTNDVANIGANAAIDQCRKLIYLTKKLFPFLKSIGWLALSPRTKPSRTFNSTDIDMHYRRFNQMLKELGNEMNIDIINANLQLQHLHVDGLHPSITSGRNLIENALINWFNKKYSILNNQTKNDQFKQPDVTFMNNNKNNKNSQNLKYNDNKIFKNLKYYDNKNLSYNDNKNEYYSYDDKPIYNPYQNKNKKLRLYAPQCDKIKNKNNDMIHDTRRSENQLHIPGKLFIPYYPHFLRHKEEFFRKIEIPQEFQKEKEEIFLLSNLHYQTEFFKAEASKWKIYITAASNKQNKTTTHNEPMEIIIEENDSLPIARPSPNGLAGPPALLDFTDCAEIFDEWLPEPTPGQKRKIGQRRDDPPTPPPIRQPPPVRPRQMLPARDPDQPLIGGSLQSSPNLEKNDRQYRSFNSLCPIEIKSTNQNLLIINEPSMIVSPIKVSTPETTKKSPSVIPKNISAPFNSFEFSIIPIECRYHFKKTKQKCTFETIKAHQEFLERKYKTLEEETENKLHKSFKRETWTQIVGLVRQIVEKTIESKTNNDKKRLDNLLLDQMRKKASLFIEQKGTIDQQEHIKKTYEKFLRTLELKFQLDKLEKRFVDNLPPPSLNILDKLELHAKELKADNNHLKSLREQWKNILRKTKLELTHLMRQAKIVEIEKTNAEYNELEKKLADNLRESYNTICQVSQTRHNQFAKKRLNFLAKRACATNEN